MQCISLVPLINLHVMDLFIQVLGFNDTYIWLMDDNPTQKKRGNLRLTKDLNANSKVTHTLHKRYFIILNNVLTAELQEY